MGNPCFVIYKNEKFTPEQFMAKLMDKEFDKYVYGGGKVGGGVTSLLESGEPNAVGLSKKEISKQVEEFDMLPPSRRDKITDAELDTMADNAISGGYDVDKLVLELREDKRTIPNDLQVVILNKYAAALNKEMSANPSKETLKKYTETLDAARKGFSIVGATLRQAQRNKIVEEENISNFLADRQMAKGVELSQSEIKAQSEKFAELKKAKEELEASLEIEREKNAKLIAEKGLNKAIAEKNKASKKTSEEYKKERTDAIQQAREALKKLRSGESGLMATAPLVNELIAIAPHVKKYVQSLVEQGISKLEDVVSDTHAAFKDVVEGITKADIYEIIGGVHDKEKQQTRNEKALELRLLKREAELLVELQKARKGEEEAKTEKAKTEKTLRIQELEKKIKETRELNAKSELAETPQENSINIKSDEQRNAERQKSLLKRIEKLNDDIKNKKYAEEKQKLPPLKLDRKTQLLQNKVIELEKKIREEDAEMQRLRMSKWERVYDNVQKQLGTSRLMQTVLDYSVLFRQLSRLSMNPLKWRIFGKVFLGGIDKAKSQENFDKLMYDIRKDEDYHEMIENKVVFNEMELSVAGERNEFFPKSFIYYIPIVRQAVLGSQRLADGAINIARYELYKHYKKRMLKEGITPQSDPEAYKALGKLVMNSTGRGNLPKMLENTHAQKVLGNTFYGARLMASTFNNLNPMYYKNLYSANKTLGSMALVDLASRTATIFATGAALVAAGGVVQFDPDEPDFLQVRFGDKVYDLTAGEAAYIRTFLRWVEAGAARAMGRKYQANEKMKFAWESTLTFFRNKLSPNNGYLLNAYVGKNSIGQDFNPTDILKMYPMYADDAYKAAQQEGWLSILTTLVPNLIGVGYGSYYSEPQKQPLDNLLERNLRSDEQDFEKIKNYKAGGRELTDEEIEKYIDKRDEFLKDKLTIFYNNGLPKEVNGKIVTVPYKELSQEEIIKETSRLKADATKLTKEQLFGKKSKKEKNEDKKENKGISKARKRIYNY